MCAGAGAGYGAVTMNRTLRTTTVTALGIAERPGRPVVETLVDGLPERGLLLLVDGCEHVLDACAELVERLLRECPDVHVLATSQEPLGIAGETVWRVEPLPAAEAAALFAERAGAVAPRLRLEGEAACPLGPRLRRGRPSAGWRGGLPARPEASRRRRVRPCWRHEDG